MRVVSVLHSGTSYPFPRWLYLKTDETGRIEEDSTPECGYTDL